MEGFRRHNIPVPEGHVIALVAGVTLHARRPWSFTRRTRKSVALGGSLVALGMLLAVWAVAAVKEIDVESPDRLVVSGPYAHSRNPMYLAWTLVYAGITILVASWWLLSPLPALLAFTHRVVIRREEQELEERFGAEYRDYMSSVHRYGGLPRGSR
jgi:protein-S-isoprenylcysteine O-methyltransferase Ste14